MFKPIVKPTAQPNAKPLLKPMFKPILKSTAQPMQKPILTLQHACVQFDGRSALKNIDLVLNECEIVSIIGPNGAGKSTLVRVILGLQRLHSGTRQVQQGLSLGYVPQKIHLSPSLPLRVCDFLALMQAEPAHFQQIMAETGIAHLQRRAMQQLSGGERQRVLLARALLARPQLLLLDEPMQGLDPQSEIELYAYVRSVPERYGCAVVMVSHDLQWVMQGTQRVICLNHHICCSGSPAHVQADPAYQALFGVGRVWYEHHHDHCRHDDLHPHSTDPATDTAHAMVHAPVIHPEIDPEL